MSKAPQRVLDSIFAFPPNRETLGGTAYLIVGNPCNILVDCPAWTPENQAFIAAQGGLDRLVITHRQGIGKGVADLQKIYQCAVIIQEQEAYLLPKISVTCFQDTLTLDSETQVLWTPGHSPGSACLYLKYQGGCLFTGRHLLPDTTGKLGPIKTATTFHWPRQLRSVQRLCQRFSRETLAYILPGAHVGFLRGQSMMNEAYTQLLACCQA